jgi:anthranilate/para-aminobenzoate synthase component I
VTIRPIAGTRPRGKTAAEDIENGLVYRWLTMSW